MTVLVKKGVYKEKVILPSWLEDVDFIGENVENTIITYDDHANINKMGTFRTYTLKVEGSSITFKNLTIENNAARLGQAVALHTEGDRLVFINCRFFGQSGYYLHRCKGTRLCFLNCYIEGTTDFIFGPSTALFHNCTIHSKANSYITAASTPKDIEVGYVFKNCKLTAAPDVIRFIWGVRGVPMQLQCSLTARWVNISVRQDGIIGVIRRMKKQPVMLNMVIRERGLIIQIG